MRRWTIGLSILLVVIVVVLIIMFTGDEAGETTTTQLGATTTSTVLGTTTTGDGTTTTSGESTTTTNGSTTTSAPSALEGNWAEEPLIVAGFGALGWWDGGGWIQVNESTSLPVAGGEDYQVALLGLEARTTGGGEELLCEPLNNPGVILTNEELLGDLPGPIGVAISADWVLVPYVVEEMADDGTYATVASELLADRGLTVADPLIKQVIRFDLEGDGVNEVVVVAEDVPQDLFAEVGDYSIAFLQKVVEGEVATSVIGESVITELDEGETPFSFTVAAIADMNGDSTMEVVLDSAYYEGVGVEVWEYVNNDIGPMAQISAGCGA